MEQYLTASNHDEQSTRRGHNYVTYKVLYQALARLLYHDVEI